MIDFAIEKEFKGLVIGLDEVGRGPLAGPVISCGCIFYNYEKKDEYNKIILDSKQISKKKRNEAYKLLQKLKKNKIINYYLGMASVKEIDNLNILEATKLSMKRVVDKFKLSDVTLIIDGNFRLKHKNYIEKSIIRGDRKSISIAAASIIAKIHRDRIMSILSTKFTNFKWNENSGYGTKKHIMEIRDKGATIHHRKSFEPVKSMLNF